MRVLLTALIASALSIPAHAQTTPYAAMSGAPQSDAAQPNLGGGFIEFLFGGAAREPAVQRPYQAGAEYQADPRGYPQPPAMQQAFASPAGQQYASPQPGSANYVSASAYAPSSDGDMAHPQVDPQFDRQEVDYRSDEKPGTIIIDTPHHFLFLVEDNGRALRYGIGVGRPGFTWAGVKTVSAKKEWPDWYPPSEMIARRPDLPRYMAGGPENPLGARALYLGSTLYRIHGSNEPWTIGTNVSSGCIRLRNADVIDLYSRVAVGAKVVVM